VPKYAHTCNLERTSTKKSEKIQNAGTQGPRVLKAQGIQESLWDRSLRDKLDYGK